MQGSVSITRSSSSREKEFIVIRVASNNQGVDIKLSLEEFALLVTGRVLTDIEIQITPLLDKQ